MLTRYSDKYKESGRTFSPVSDILVTDKDLDAVLGVIENEIMELPDGKLFYPDKPVTNLEFLSWIKQSEQKS